MLRKSSWFIFLVLITYSAIAQNRDGNAPYSRFGIGELPMPGLTRYIAMGGTGVANADSTLINLINPAFIASNPFTTFEGGVSVHYNYLSDGENTERNGVANFSNVSMLFPVIRDPRKKVNWTTNIGYGPYSSVNYINQHTQPIPGTPGTSSRVTSQGFGGLDKVYFSNGFRIDTNFFIGIETGFIFGSINREIRSQILGQPTATISTERTSHSGFRFKTGLGYRKTLGSAKNITPVLTTNRQGDTTRTYTKEKNDSIILSLGAVYEFSPTTWANQQFRITTQDAFGRIITGDTLLDNIRGNILLPWSITGGLSIERFTDVRKRGRIKAAPISSRAKRKWRYNLDLSFQNWSSFQNFQGMGALRNSFSVAAGLEYSPKYDDIISSKAYQMGVRYTQLPFVINGQQVHDFGMTFGVSLPMSYAYRSISRINIAITAGRRGQATDGLIEQFYVNGHISFMVNNSNWFRRRQID